MQKSTGMVILFIHFLNWPELKVAKAVPKVTWQLFHKCSPSLHLGDLLSPVKSPEDAQSAVFAFCTCRSNSKAAQKKKKKGLKILRFTNLVYGRHMYLRFAVLFTEPQTKSATLSIPIASTHNLSWFSFQWFVNARKNFLSISKLYYMLNIPRVTALLTMRNNKLPRASSAKQI